MFEQVILAKHVYTSHGNNHILLGATTEEMLKEHKFYDLLGVENKFDKSMYTSDIVADDIVYGAFPHGVKLYLDAADNYAPKPCNGWDTPARPEMSVASGWLSKQLLKATVDDCVVSNYPINLLYVYRLADGCKTLLGVVEHGQSEYVTLLGEVAPLPERASLEFIGRRELTTTKAYDRMWLKFVANPKYIEMPGTRDQIFYHIERGFMCPTMGAITTTDCLLEATNEKLRQSEDSMKEDKVMETSISEYAKITDLKRNLRDGETVYSFNGYIAHEEGYYKPNFETVGVIKPLSEEQPQNKTVRNDIGYTLNLSDAEQLKDFYVRV